MSQLATLVVSIYRQKPLGLQQILIQIVSIFIKILVFGTRLATCVLCNLQLEIAYILCCK